MFTKLTKLVLVYLITCIAFAACSTQKQFDKVLKVHFIDIGQGDSILIQYNTRTMLIDTGPKEKEDELLEYLDSQNIKKIDYLILTHQHNDHIGNASKVIKKYNIGMLYMPDVTSNSNEFETMTNSIDKRKLKITRPIPGSSFSFGDVQCFILAPNSKDYENENDYSIVIKMTFKNTSFLFTGDAQFYSENEMINKGYDLSADVLKIGQHGNNKATSEEFLNLVNPKYAALSCAKNDSNDHPSKATMKLLKSKNIPVFRTDECGTILCTSDGEIITFDKEPGDYKHGKNN